MCGESMGNNGGFMIVWVSFEPMDSIEVDNKVSMWKTFFLAAIFLYCQYGTMPFVYLGLLVSENPRKINIFSFNLGWDHYN